MTGLYQPQFRLNCRPYLISTNWSLCTTLLTISWSKRLCQVLKNLYPPGTIDSQSPFPYFKVLPITSIWQPRPALRKFLTKRGDKKGPLFCHPDNSPITYSQFNSALADILTYLGGEAKINLHSFRIGAASWAAMNGFTELQIKHLGRWKSDAFRKYIRIQSITI